MIIINSPHNPTGTILRKEDLIELEKITANSNIIVLSDEVYEHLIYDDENIILFVVFLSYQIVL